MGFETTQWSLVLNAGVENAKSRAAFEELTRIYWPPLFVYLRGKGMNTEDARDAVQSFFLYLFEKDVPKKADPSRGRFRTFLLTALNNFLSHEYAKANAMKRGGGAVHVSLDTESLDVLESKIATQKYPPEHMFDQQWAIECVREALHVVESEYRDRGKGAVFVVLKDTLVSSDGKSDYAAKAAALSMSDGAVRVAIHRLRKRYGAALKAEVVRTVEDPALVEEELAYLIQVLGGR